MTSNSCSKDSLRIEVYGTVPVPSQQRVETATLLFGGRLKPYSCFFGVGLWLRVWYLESICVLFIQFLFDVRNQFSQRHTESNCHFMKHRQRWNFEAAFYLGDIYLMWIDGFSQLLLRYFLFLPQPLNRFSYSNWKHNFSIAVYKQLHYKLLLIRIIASTIL